MSKIRRGGHSAEGTRRFLPGASNIWKPPGPGCAHGASAALLSS